MLTDEGVPVKHVALFLSSLALAALGFYVVAVNARHETTPILVFGGINILVALALAFPTDLGVAGTAIATIGAAIAAAFAAVMNAVKAWKGQASS